MRERERERELEKVRETEPERGCRGERQKIDENRGEKAGSAEE